MVDTNLGSCTINLLALTLRTLIWVCPGRPPLNPRVGVNILTTNEETGDHRGWVSSPRTKALKWKTWNSYPGLSQFQVPSTIHEASQIKERKKGEKLKPDPPKATKSRILERHHINHILSKYVFSCHWINYDVIQTGFYESQRYQMDCLSIWCFCHLNTVLEIKTNRNIKTTFLKYGPSLPYNKGEE